VGEESSETVSYLDLGIVVSVTSERGRVAAVSCENVAAKALRCVVTSTRVVETGLIKYR